MPIANTTIPKPNPTKADTGGSGTPGGGGFRVTANEAEKVFDTTPVVANWASTVWNGTVNCEVKFPSQVLRPSALTPVNTKLAMAFGPVGAGGGLLIKLKGEAFGPGISNVHTCPMLGTPPQVLGKIPWKTSEMFIADSSGIPSKVMKSCGAKGASTSKLGSVTLFKSRIVTIVPPSPTNEPVKPVFEMTALSTVKGAPLSCHVIVVGVTNMVPSILKLPKIGDADRVMLHVAINNATNSSLPNLLPRIIMLLSSV